MSLDAFLRDWLNAPKPPSLQPPRCLICDRAVLTGESAGWMPRHPGEQPPF